MAEKCLDGPYVRSALEQVGGKRVPEGMRGGTLVDADGADGLANCPLDNLGPQVVAPDCIAPRVLREIVGGKDILPPKFARGIRILPPQRVRHPHGAAAIGEVACVQGADDFDLVAEAVRKPAGKDGDPVFPPLAVPDDHLMMVEVEILDPEPQSLQNPKSGTVEKSGDKANVAFELRKDRLHFPAAQNNRQLPEIPGSQEAAEVSGIDAENVLVQKDQGIECLVLGRGSDLTVDGEIGEKFADFLRAHFAGMPLSVEEDEASDPMEIGILGAEAVVPDTDRIAYPVEEPWLGTT